jgi:hypothetical protein
MAMSESPHHKQAARDSAKTKVVKRRSSGDQEVSGPRAVSCQRVLRKKRTWSVWGRAAVQSGTAVVRVEVGGEEEEEEEIVFEGPVEAVGAVEAVAAVEVVFSDMGVVGVVG